MSHRALSTFLACWTTGAIALGGTQVAVPTLEKGVDRFLEPFVDLEHLSGTVLIARHGEVEHEKSFGLAHREHGVANTASTRYCIGSINKPMTIVILARLLDAGKLARDDALDEYVPDFPRAGEITVEHLLRHRAGIPHRVTEPLDEIRPQSPASMVRLAAGRPLTFAPGSDSSYSSAADADALHEKEGPRGDDDKGMSHEAMSSLYLSARLGSAS